MLQNFKETIALNFQLFAHPEIKKIKKEGLTYLEPDGLIAIKKVIRRIESMKVPGCFIEAGCALGGSAILIGLAKQKERPFFIYDIFGMIPPPSDKDGSDVFARYEIIRSGYSPGIKDNKYYGYETDIKNKVIGHLTRYGLDLADKNISLVEGLYQDTLHITEPVAFAHIDCDWYDSVMTCLIQITPNLSEGGVMIIDDYYCWSGCKAATIDYFKDMREKYLFLEVAEKLHITKKRAI